MRIFRSLSFFSNGSGEVIVDRDFSVDYSDEYMVGIRFKILDSDSDLYGWNWVFVGEKNDNVVIYLNGVEQAVTETIDSGDVDFSYWLDNCAVSQIAAWSKWLTEDEMNVVMRDGVVAARNLLLWLVFHDDNVLVFSKQNASVIGGEWMDGDSVDSVYYCRVAKVVGNG